MSAEPKTSNPTSHPSKSVTIPPSIFAITLRIAWMRRVVSRRGSRRYVGSPTISQSCRSQRSSSGGTASGATLASTTTFSIAMYSSAGMRCGHYSRSFASGSHPRAYGGFARARHSVPKWDNASRDYGVSFSGVARLGIRTSSDCGKAACTVSKLASRRTGRRKKGLSSVRQRRRRKRCGLAAENRIRFRAFVDVCPRGTRLGWRGAGCGVRGAGCGVRGAGCGVRGAGRG